MQLNLPLAEVIYLRLAVNDVRKTQLQEILPNDIIALEQTRPPMAVVQLNKIVLLTYKAPGQKINRLGFEARIKEITADYRIILHKLNDPAPCDLRVLPRMCLDLLPDVRAFSHDKEIQVIDISGGGAHVILKENDCLVPEVAGTVNMKLVFEKGEVTVEGEILRKWKDSSQRDHVAIRFLGTHNISQFIY